MTFTKHGGLVDGRCVVGVIVASAAGVLARGSLRKNTDPADLLCNRRDLRAYHPRHT